MPGHVARPGSQRLSVSTGQHDLWAIADFAYFEGSEGIRKISAVALPPHTWAFCLTVHKSQGSEFDHVVLLWPDGAQKFGRAGLYTGVTRAKKQIDLVSTPEVFHATLKN